MGLIRLFILLYLSVSALSYSQYIVVVNEPIDTMAINATAQAQSGGQNTSPVIPGIIQSNLFFERTSSYAIQTQGTSRQSSLITDNWGYVVRIDESKEAEFLNGIKQLSSFVHVQPNYTYHAAALTSANLNQDQFELMGFDADVYDIASGNGVVVAVIDSGIDVNTTSSDATPSANSYHPAFTSSGKIVHPYDTVNVSITTQQGALDNEDYEGVDPNPDDNYSGHGTHVAGIIAANGSQMVGAAFGANIMPIRAMYAYQAADGNRVVGTTESIVKGINYAVSNNAHVINMSFGASNMSGDLMLRIAVNNAYNAGVVVVAAAGNDHQDIDDNHFAPAYYSSSLAVSSVSKDGAFSSFSNFGDSIDVAAVGQDVYSSILMYGAQSNGYNNSGYGTISGTSMAAPYVSALAALLKGYNKSLTAFEIYQLIRNSASRDSSSKSYQTGYGIINARRALFMAGATALHSSDDPIILGSTGVHSEVLCYPNPFDLRESNKTTCEYFLNETAASIDIRIYSRRGTLVYYDTGSGDRPVEWNGRDRSGDIVPNGVYQLILTVQSTSTSEKIVSKHLITVYQ